MSAVVAPLLAILLLACADARMAELRPTVSVELDVYSGIPNPSWALSSAEAAALPKFLSGLPPSRRPPAEGGLGYRGFVVLIAGEAAESVPDEVRVYDGLVRVTAGGRVSDYEDVHRLEDWLMEQARQRGYGDIVDQGSGARSP